MGGARKAIEAGYIQNEIQDAAYTACRAIEAGEQVVVGVNKFLTSRAAPPGDLLRIDEAVQAEQIERLRDLRTGRDATAVRASWPGCAAHAALRGGGGRLRDAGRDLQHVARRVWGV